jgi:hypothetical protein
MTSVLRALVVVAAVAAGCVPGGSLAPPATPSITSPVEGVVVSVDAASIGDVRGFTLRPANSPFSFGFILGTLENPTEFPPSHLAEHQATSQPVRVYFRTANGIHTAYRLEDAAPSGS